MLKRDHYFQCSAEYVFSSSMGLLDMVVYICLFGYLESPNSQCVHAHYFVSLCIWSSLVRQNICLAP
jgi:hypothetical protein